MRNLILDLLSKNEMNLIFTSQGARMESNYISILKSEEERNEFTDLVRDVMESIVAIVDGEKKLNEIENEDVIEILNFLVEQNPNYFQDIKIKKNYINDVYDLINFEVLTKRNPKEINEVVGYTVLVKLENSFAIEPPKTSFELTASDIEKLIEKMSIVLEDLKKLN